MLAPGRLGKDAVEVSFKDMMKTKAIGERLCWHIEGTLNETVWGTIIALLGFHHTEGVRAYVVKPDDLLLLASIIPTYEVVEGKEDD